MSHPPYPTLHADVNRVLDHFRSQLHELLGDEFVGMYLVGSLALGDFNPNGSDIDIVVATSGEIGPNELGSLKQLHSAFSESGSPWSSRVEAIYIPTFALRSTGSTGTVASHFPEIEKGRAMDLAPLEDGWIFQCLTIRDHGVRIMGPDPMALVLC